MKKWSSVIVAIFLLSAIGCKTEPPKIGVVDIVKVVNSSKAGQKANTEVDALVKAKQSKINEKGEAIKKLKENPKAKSEDVNRAVVEYQKLVAQADAEVKKKAGEMRKIVFDQIKKAIDDIGQQEKFLMIVTTDNVPFFQPTLDLTDNVIKKYDESAACK